MSRVVLVVGGARSGKSTFAERLAESANERLLYIATAQRSDAEMAARIETHVRDRERTGRRVDDGGVRRGGAERRRHVRVRRCARRLPDAVADARDGGVRLAGGRGRRRRRRALGADRRRRRARRDAPLPRQDARPRKRRSCSSRTKSAWPRVRTRK
ncbi:cobinamide phosphate guanyltransferase-domain-containing protein [Obelidium mucronatum]|nr:cobinamide phosphate guanyltransferase-domain-containing protein [Obelidium mucronatum]